MIRLAFLWAFLLAAHLRTSRRRGSHNEKTHGSWSPRNPFANALARKKEIEKLAKPLPKKKPSRKMAMTRKKKDAAKKAVEKKLEPTIDPFGDDVIYDDAGTVIVMRDDKPKQRDLEALKGAYPDATDVLWGDGVHDVTGIKGALPNRARPNDKPSDSFTVTGVDKYPSANDHVKGALEAVDGVHGVRGLAPTTIKLQKMPDEEGRYRTRMRGGRLEPGAVYVHPDGATPAFTAVHEMGHHLDLSSLGPGGAFGSQNTNSDPKLRAWYDAVKGSDGYKDIIRKRSADRELRDYYDYLLTPEELFARSYAQWVAERSGDPQLKRDLDYWRDSDLSEQWSDDDFASIASALDKMLEPRSD